MLPVWALNVEEEHVGVTAVVVFSVFFSFLFVALSFIL